jgi:hypothetical protein
MIDKRFVKVRWHDAQDGYSTWVAAEDIPRFTEEPCEVVSWGWLVSETKRYITLAADYIPGPPGETYGRVTKIPRGMVVKIEEFEQE